MRVEKQTKLLPIESIDTSHNSVIVKSSLSTLGIAIVKIEVIIWWFLMTTWGREPEKKRNRKIQPRYWFDISLDCNYSSLLPYIKDSVTKEDFVIVAGGIENANDGHLDSTEILKNDNWEEGT